MKKLIYILFLCLSITACERDKEKNDYNVYFYYPDGREIYLGETKGLSYCGDLAWDTAYQLKLDNNPNWSYICCWKTKNSECKEKHR